MNKNTISGRRRLSRNKRGEDMMVDFWSILIFTIIVLLFLIIFSIGKHSMKKNVEADFENKDANFMLLSFLRAPAIDYDSTKTVADIIAEDEAKDNFMRTEDLFHKFFKYSSEGSKIRIEIDGNHDDSMEINNKISVFSKVLLFKDTGYWIKGGDTYQAETYIPGYDGRIYLKIKKVDTTTDKYT